MGPGPDSADAIAPVLSAPALRLGSSTNSVRNGTPLFSSRWQVRVAANSLRPDTGSSSDADITAPLPSATTPRADESTREIVPTRDLTPAFTGGEDQWDDMPVARSERSNVRSVASSGALRGRYILEAEIGHGGGGAVYRALDLNRVGLPREHQYVALKVLAENAARRPNSAQALRCEFHRAQSLSHPGIVNVFDFDHEADLHFVTMELIDGESLGALTRRLSPQKLPAEMARRTLFQLGDAVAYAHERGILHLDLKPDNVMIDATGNVRVLDFGLAHSPMEEPWNSANHLAAATPAYASCERLVQERPDARDDVFSFSCIAYELLTGKHPFDRSSALRARKEGRTPQRTTDLSSREWQTLKRGLAWARESRPMTMRELLHGLALEPREQSQIGRRSLFWRQAASASVLTLMGVAGLAGEWMERHLRNDVDNRIRAAGRNSLSPSPAFANDRIPEASPPLRAPATPSTSPAVSPDSPVAQVEAAPRPTQLRSDSPVAAHRSLPAPTPKAAVVPSDMLGFSQHSYPVSEADSAAQITVRRTGDAAGDISFQWRTTDESATAARDYVFEFGEEHMAPGQMTATLVVPIVGDSTPENPELLHVVIENPRGATVGPAGRLPVPIIIVDDD